MPLIAIVGPTASGKTDLSIALAQLLRAEIISADSMMIYRFMDIGTAKPTIAERKNIPHYMIDIVNPWENYNVATYQSFARERIDTIHSNNKIPIIVGGTGLFVNSLVMQMNFTDAGTDSVIKDKLVNDLNHFGCAHMYNKLCEVDKERALQISPNDAKRIIRALEVFFVTGKKMSAQVHDAISEESIYDLTIYGLQMDRQMLYSKIDKRVDKMFAGGLIEEVKFLQNLGCDSNMQAMQGIGYKQVFDLISGERDLDGTKELIKMNTRRYAKRQITWFKKNDKVNWIDVEKYDKAEMFAEFIAKDIRDKLL